ncbi:phage tail tape measure protein, partial [Acetobacter sp. DsW_063]|uniref:phage tail tape measure protein n=1 Tax=Acetobacter sp. DsW_063 TaxID=1514894 RepID=UPI000A3AAAAC
AARGLNETLSQTTRAVTGVSEATVGLDEALSETSGAMAGVATATAALDEALGATSASAGAAGSGLAAVGGEAEEAANRVASAADRMKSAMAGVRAMNEFHAGYGGASGDGSSGMDRLRGVGRAVGGFGDSIESGVGHAFGAAATGFGLIEPIHAAAEYDNDLTHVGITLGKDGAANAPFARALGERIDAIARQTGQRSTELAGAASFLSQEGYSFDNITAFLPQIAKISTAYNSAPDAVAKTAFALNQNLGISKEQLPTALATVARVGKESALPLEQLAPLFPDVAATAAQLGVRGPQGLADLSSMLAIIRKNVGGEGKATTDLRQVMSTLTSQHGRRRFRQLLGWDPRDIMDQANKQGRDPLSAVMDGIMAIREPLKRQHAISDLFVGMEDQTGASAMIRQFSQMMEIRTRLQNTSPKMVDDDFDTGLQSTLIRLQSFEDGLGQLQRRIGTSFVPTLNVLTTGVHLLTEGFDWLNRVTGGWGSSIAGATGGFLAFATVLGVLRALAAPLRGGLALIGSVLRLVGLRAIGARMALATIPRLLPLIANPVGATVAALAALGFVAYEVVHHWDALRPYFTGLGHWMSSWASSISTYLGEQFSHIFDGLLTALHGVEHLFMSSPARVLFSHDWTPRVPVMAQAAPAAASQTHGASANGGRDELHLHITAAPGLQVRQTGGSTRARVTTNTGNMVTQP